MKLASKAILVTAAGALAVPAVALATTLGTARQAAAPAVARTISVNGSATVNVTPDEAVVSLGVTHDATTASAALSGANAAMARVIAAEKDLGVAAKDIQTQQVSVSTRTDEKDHPIGFTAVDAITVTVHDVSLAGPAIDRGIAAGANQVSGPTFQKANTDDVYRAALAAALSQARAKAQTLAARAGLHLGRAESISESSYAQPIPYASAAPAADGAAKAAPTPIEAGSYQVVGSVSVVYQAS